VCLNSTRSVTYKHATEGVNSAKGDGLSSSSTGGVYSQIIDYVCGEASKNHEKEASKKRQGDPLVSPAKQQNQTIERPRWIEDVPINMRCRAAPTEAAAFRGARLPEGVQLPAWLQPPAGKGWRPAISVNFLLVHATPLRLVALERGVILDAGLSMLG
jgi:hypothetical protein